MEYEIFLILREFKDLAKDIYFHAFLFIMIFDILTGISKSIILKTTSSRVGINGVTKHLLVLILVFFVYPYLKLMEMDAIAITFIGFYVVFYLTSINENFKAIGLDLPTKLVDLVKGRLNG